MTDVIQVYSIMLLFLIITYSFKGYSIHIATYTTDKIKTVNKIYPVSDPKPDYILLYFISYK